MDKERWDLMSKDEKHAYSMSLSLQHMQMGHAVVRGYQGNWTCKSLNLDGTLCGASIDMDTGAVIKNAS